MPPGVVQLGSDARGKESWTIPLTRLASEHLALAGAKAVSLGRLTRAGLPVPPGFVLAAPAFQQFTESVPDWGSVQAALAKVDRTDRSAIEPLSRQIQSVLADRAVPVEVEQAIRSALAQFPQVPFWAVRSSATAEDLPEASFAGQHDSFLDVSRDDIPARVRQCWLSLFSSRALQYRAQQGVAQSGVAMAVIVQQMVPAEMAGVLFTADPMTGDSKRVVIEGAPGLGEKVVGGRVTPDRIVLAKSSLEVLERFAGGAAQSLPRVADSEKNETRAGDAPAGLRVLDDATAKRLVELSAQAERVLPGPLDIEWAICAGQIQLLQARPITGQPPVRTWVDRQVWSNMNTGEVFPDVTTPITWSMIRVLMVPLSGSVFRLGGADATRAPAVGLVAGRIYFNVNTGLAACKPFFPILQRIPNLAQALGGGQIDLIEQSVVGIPEEDLPDLGFRWPKYILSWPRLVWDLVTHSPGRGDAWTVRLKARGDELAQLDLGSMSTSQLAQSFVRLMMEGFEGWDLLYLLTQGAALPLFQKACQDWLDDKDLALGYRLFAALGGVPEAEAGLALWRLAALAHNHPETKTALLSADRWQNVGLELDRTEPGRQFLAAWEAFMAEHGHHCRGELELFNARWAERPDYILGLVRNYLLAIGQSNPIENQRRLAQEREQLTEQCRRRLKNPIKRWIFTRSLRRAQRLAINREEWKNQAVRHLTVLRRILLRLGDQLQQQGILTRSEDIFFLEVPEIEPVATGRAKFDAQERIGARRAQYEANLTLTPPSVVVGRFDPAIEAAPVSGPSARVLTGIPVFPGTVTGPARVILRSDDHDQVLSGEILVAPFTDPAWTPYFVPAAGVVMEQGGILSHGSIIAREYGLPAVTNVGSATRLIKTGDLIQVDGSRGRVVIVSSFCPA
jgi:phosphohistidine swiveling domain-containing protein